MDFSRLEDDLVFFIDLRNGEFWEDGKILWSDDEPMQLRPVHAWAHILKIGLSEAFGSS